MHPLQVVRKGFDSSCIMPSFRGALSVRLVIESTIITIATLVASLLLDAFSLLAPVFDLAMCISIADDIVQVLVIPIMPLATLLWSSETAGRVPMWTLPVIKILTPVSIIAVVNRVHHGCCVQHRLEALYVRVDFLIVFWQMRCELVNEHPRGQGIVSWRAVDLLSLALNPADFLVDQPLPFSEPVLTSRVT
jgi:hypothetical protein